MEMEVAERKGILDFRFEISDLKVGGKAADGGIILGNEKRGERARPRLFGIRLPSLARRARKGVRRLVLGLFLLLILLGFGGLLA